MVSQMFDLLYLDVNLDFLIPIQWDDVQMNQAHG